MSLLGDLLADYKPFDENEEAYVKQLQHFLAEGSNHYDRSNLVAHVIGDAWIVNPARTHTVLLEHAAGRIWLSPGGHCDGNPDVLGAALREAEEEAGLKGLKPLCGGGLYDINTGLIPNRRKKHGLEPAHLHFDICFAFEAPDNAPLKISDESTQLAWVPIDALPGGYWHEHYRRPAKTLAGWLA